MIILFLVLWALFFFATLLMIAATPTTVQTSNSDLIVPLIITAGMSGVVTLMVAGLIALF